VTLALTGADKLLFEAWQVYTAPWSYRPSASMVISFCFTDDEDAVNCPEIPSFPVSIKVSPRHHLTFGSGRPMAYNNGILITMYYTELFYFIFTKN